MGSAGVGLASCCALYSSHFLGSWTGSVTAVFVDHQDHVWVTQPLGPRVTAHEVFRETRTWEKPSDHVPVIVDVE